MQLTISSASVPVALIPLAVVASTLNVSASQAVDWCRSGQLMTQTSPRVSAVTLAERLTLSIAASSPKNVPLRTSAWWVSVAALTTFVERSKWQLVEAAPARIPSRGRRR